VVGTKGALGVVKYLKDRCVVVQGNKRREPLLGKRGCTSRALREPVPMTHLGHTATRLADDPHLFRTGTLFRYDVFGSK
jgi:hypothetical protein